MGSSGETLLPFEHNTGSEKKMGARQQEELVTVAHGDNHHGFLRPGKTELFSNASSSIFRQSDKKSQGEQARDRWEV